MTFYDGLALVIIGVSAFAGFWRGGARETISFFAFLVAGLIALLALPLTGPIGRDLIDPDWAGTAFAVVGGFGVLYLFLRILAGWIGRRLQDHDTLGGVDRMAGLAFGVGRALIVLGIIHLLFYASTPAHRIPNWYRFAAVFPVGKAAARVLQIVLPQGARVADRVAPVVERNVRRGASGQPQSDVNGAGPNTGASRAAAYDRTTRQDMDRLVETTR